MSKVIVCFKCVKTEEDIRITPELTVDLSKAKGKVSDYDRNAIETARLCAEKTGSEAVGLTFGDENAKASLKDALARGLKQVYWVNDKAAENADGFVTANALSAAIRKIGDYSLIICAEGAADTYAHQTGPRIGALLGIPVISCVKSIRIQENKITAVRKLETLLETVEVELPAVVTILPEINPAPIPGLKAVLEAGKKEIANWRLSDLELSDDQLRRKTEILVLKGYAMDRKNVVYKEGAASERVAAFMAALKKEGVL